MTVSLDITGLREKKLNLYPTMLYMLATVVNGHEKFRTALDSHGHVGIYDTLIPCYTVFNKESETFSNIWTSCLLTLAVQVHHAVCDGFHLSRFINELQEMIHKFPMN